MTGPREAPSDAEVRRILAEVRADLDRMPRPAIDVDDVLRQRVRRMLGTVNDPDVHNDIWDHLEGKITWRQLRRRPAFAAAWRAERAALTARLEGSGLDRVVPAYLESVEGDDADSGGGPGSPYRRR